MRKGKRGDVSLAYVSRLMHRDYRETPLFRKVLQTIWHQVNHGQEIYVVGQILEDDTVLLRIGDPPTPVPTLFPGCSVSFLPTPPPSG